MDETLTIFLRHVTALREKGVLRVKCGEFEAELAPFAPAAEESGEIPELERPKKRGLRDIMGVTRG